MRISDWSSDVCSSDLHAVGANPQVPVAHGLCKRRPVPLLTLRFHEQEIVSGAVHLHESHGGGPATRSRVIWTWPRCIDRKSVVSGTSVSVRVDAGCSRIIKKKKEESCTRSSSI